MKKKKILFWICTIFLFLFEGVMPLATLILAPDMVDDGATYLGYPKYFTYMIIAFKVSGAILLLIPSLPQRLREWVYAGFAFNFICACLSHLAVDGAVFVSFFPLIFVGLLVISYIYHPKFRTNG